MRTIAAAFTVAFALTVSASETTVRWTQQLKESVELLKSNQHERALKLNNRLVAEMVEQLGPGDGATAAFALALTHKALAHAGLGQKDDALWHWHTVTSLYPKLADDDLSMFGEAGRFLMANRTPDPNAANTTKKGDATSPKLLKRVEPRFPEGARLFGVAGLLVVEVLVDRDGHISQPKILQPLPAPTLSYSALSAIRRWKFTPAKVAGEPVPFIFRLAVNFKID